MATSQDQGYFVVAYKRSILFFIFLWLIGHKSSASTESFSGNINEWFKATTSVQGQGLPVSTITFSSNVKLGKHEFFYLTDLKENSTITRDEIARAYRRLMAKKRFSQISFDIKEEDSGTNLHVTLTAQWLFKKVFFDDIWLRASTFQQLYLQQPGNPFEAQEHEESLVAIKKQLYNQGFFNSTPEDHLHFNEKDKTVTVHISLNKKERFTIKNVSTQLHFKNNSHADTKFLNPILKKAREALEDAPYSKKQIMRIVQQYKKILRKNRYSHIRITHTAKTDAATSSANIIFNVSAEAPRQIICTGNKAISTYDILNDIVAKQIPDWLFSPDVLKQHLLHEYYRKGYWHAHISYTKNDDDCYVFTITEGQQLNVSSVIMNGNQHPLLKQAKALIDQLAKQNILNKGLVSFLGAGGHGIEFKHYDGKLLTLGDNFNQDHPYIFNKQYFESFLHVATESWIEEFFLTEKTTMRLLFGLPFLTLGCKHFHKNLKDMGFVLYDEIFDYRFDDEELIDDRVDGIIKNIEYVLNSDVNELYQKIKEPLEYNRKVALEYVKGKTIPSIVKAQVAESTAKPTRTGLDFDLYSMSLYLTSLQ